jgi:hypothetical protein
MIHLKRSGLRESIFQPQQDRNFLCFHVKAETYYAKANEKGNTIRHTRFVTHDSSRTIRHARFVMPAAENGTVANLQTI